jgi:hypothetical protein
LEHAPDGIIRWHLAYGIIHDDHPPDRPIDAAHADHFTGRPPTGTTPEDEASVPEDATPSDTATTKDAGTPNAARPDDAGTRDTAPSGSGWPPGDIEAPEDERLWPNHDEPPPF